MHNAKLHELTILSSQRSGNFSIPHALSLCPVIATVDTMFRSEAPEAERAAFGLVPPHECPSIDILAHFHSGLCCLFDTFSSVNLALFFLSVIKRHLGIPIEEFPGKIAPLAVL